MHAHSPAHRGCTRCVLGYPVTPSPRTPTHTLRLHRCALHATTNTTTQPPQPHPQPQRKEGGEREHLKHTHTQIRAPHARTRLTQHRSKHRQLPCFVYCCGMRDLELTRPPDHSECMPAAKRLTPYLSRGFSPSANIPSSEKCLACFSIQRTSVWGLVHASVGHWAHVFWYIVNKQPAAWTTSPDTR